MTNRARPLHIWGPCLALGLVLIAIAATLLVTRDAPARAKAVPLVNIGEVPSSTTHSTAHRAIPTGMAIPRGSRLVLARLGVDAPIIDVGLSGNVMDVPRDPHTVGWWSAGARPGAAVGSVVIVGHINYAGTSGALGVLPNARTGDTVTLVESRATVRYRIVAVRSYPKSTGLPASAFSLGGPAQLVLITCGGPFDSRTGNYEDNIVAYAAPV
jgi:hypothetical protein